MTRRNVSLRSRPYSTHGSKRPQLQMMALKLARFGYRGNSKPKKQQQGLLRPGITDIATEGEISRFTYDGVQGGGDSFLS